MNMGAMNPKSKLMIRWVLCGVLDPRTGRAGSTSWGYRYYALLRMCGYGGEAGFILFVILTAPLLAIPGYFLIKHFGLDGGGVAIIVIELIAIMTFAFMEARAKRATKKFCEQHDYTLCLWCRDPIDPSPTRGRCTKCGCGYDSEVSRVLWRDLHHPLRPDAKTHKRRMKFAWARALRERDRDQES